MKGRKAVVLGVMLLALAVLVLASGCGTAALQNKMSYQGRLTDAHGNPITGTKNMAFRLFTDETGGTAIWEETHTGVQVTDGLFNVVLGENTPLDEAQFHQPLYLEVVVDGETLSPRQQLLGAPYAFSLVPGAVIKGYIAATDTYSSTLNVANFSDGQGVAAISSTGHGIYAQSGGGAYAGAALLANNTNSTDGIAIWADNESSDATLVVRNKGAGPLIKGFGGDGGEDEFRVSNNGKIETKADSYIFISGNEFIKNKDTDTTRWDCQRNGSVRIWRGGAAGTKWIYIPITLPGVLYGQEVKLKSITVYYKCQDGSKNYIMETYLYKQTGADSQVTLVADTTDRKSNTATSYTLDVNHALSSDTGILGLNLGLHFEDDTNYIQIGGVRLRLGHHHLY